ncbi:MAG TPA: hypothetical protein VHZ97_06350 [Pseudonocardiaceae bacterium]|jgi:hypothetical protein|nr:hypothetical protein [Pseudonocardiaceae bacterium]
MDKKWRQLLATGGVFAAVIVVAVVVLVVRTGSGPDTPATPGHASFAPTTPAVHPGFSIPSGITLVPLHTVPLPGICAGPAQPAILATGTAKPTANPPATAGGCPGAQVLKSGTPVN